MLAAGPLALVIDDTPDPEVHRVGPSMRREGDTAVLRWPVDLLEWPVSRALFVELVTELFELRAAAR